MKKRILLVALMVAVLAVAFAISASAATIFKTADGTELFSYVVNDADVITSYSGEFPKTDENGNDLTWYVTKSETVGTDTVKTVASVLSTDSTHFKIENGTYSYRGGTVTQNNVVSVNLSGTGISKLSLSNGGYRLSNTYSYKPYTTEILFIYLPSSLTELPERIGQGSMALICDIPLDCTIPKISHVAFHQAKCLREINVPATVTEIGGKSPNDGAAFYLCDSLERVVVGENSVLKTIGNYAFHQNLNLKEINIPNSVTSIGTHAFSYTQIVNSPFSEGSQCTTLGGRAFSDNTALKTFIVPAGLTSVSILGNNDYGPLSDCPNIELVTFGNYIPGNQIVLQPSFFGRAGIYTIVFPEGITHIPSRFFVSAKLNVVKFPNTVETIADKVFESATVQTINLGANFKYFTNTDNGANQRLTHLTNGLKYWYIPATFYAEAPSDNYKVSYAFHCGGAGVNVTFFYAGDKDQLDISIANFKAYTTSATDNNGNFLNATPVDWSVYKLDPSSYANGDYIVYNYNACDAFYNGIHEEKDAANESACYITDCKHCVYESMYIGTDKTHVFSVEYEYENGYMAEGQRISICQNVGCVHGTEQTAITSPLDAIFTDLAYSASEKGFGICVKYNVNRAALKEYKDAGNEMFFGVVAIMADNVNGGGPLANNGKVATEKNVIAADVTGSNINAVTLRISGDESAWRAHASKAIYVLGYATNGTDLEYLGTASGAQVDRNNITSVKSLVIGDFFKFNEGGND